MNRKAKKVSGHVNFFKSGVCLGRVFLCVVKSSAMSSTIKVLEPVEGLSRGRTKLGFAKLLQGGQDFKVFKVLVVICKKMANMSGILHSYRIDVNSFSEI